MKVITINLPELHISAIKALIDIGRVSSRSDFVREAIKEFLDVEFDNLDDLLLLIGGKGN
jgi:Arc/MetJ-type ribon-helix-helix transcriptional regulator